MFRKIIALLTAAGMAVALAACGQEEAGMKDIKISEKNFKELGRVYYSDGKAYCALSGTGLEFSFTGTQCSVTVSGDSNAADPGYFDNHARIAIYLNGERVVDDMIDSAEETYTVLQSDVEQECDVKIVKLSESPMSTFAITGVNINGRSEAPAEDKDKLIEFVGDSITCGYGVDDEDSSHHFSTRTEDVTKTYAYKTAEALGFDYSMVSFSGYGIISGYSDGQNKVPEQTVPQYYTKLGYSWSDNSGFRPSETDWDFKRKPDVVVINLGTNDDSYCKNIPERCEEFKAEYKNFLKLVREKNPDAEIVCALGIMGQNLYPYVEAAVSEFSSETGDEKVFCLEFDNQSQEDGIAADWHPTEKTHATASAKLVEKIKEILG